MPVANMPPSTPMQRPAQPRMTRWIVFTAECSSSLIGVNIGYTFRGVITNFQVQSDDAAQRILDAGAYTAHELYAGVVIRY